MAKEMLARGLTSVPGPTTLKATPSIIHRCRRLMVAALNLCECKLKHNIKTAAFERLSKLLKKDMLPKDGSEVTETCSHVEQCVNVPDEKKSIVHCCPCDEHRYGHSMDGD
eukprot:jgi/Tetstr1/462916/TSEL_007864.t1